MSVNYDSLLNSCFEIEGLISLLRLRQDETPEEVYPLLVEKVAILAHDLGIRIDSQEYTVIEEDQEAEAVAANAEYEECADSEGPAGASEDPSLTAVDEAVAEAAEAGDEQSDLVAASMDDVTMVEEHEDEDGGAHTVSQTALRQLFTINDKFRFRRELFGNSDAEFSDTLNILDAMSSLQEAEEYLYEDLGWDAGNPDVKDFLAVVSRHFKS